MPDVFALNAVPSLVRQRIPEIAIATANDDDDARAGTLGKLAIADVRLTIDRAVLDALDARLSTRPLPPPQETVQNLLRRARRRLAQERLGAARTYLDIRHGAVLTLRGVLES
jgi:hypothetical protein